MTNLPESSKNGENRQELSLIVAASENNVIGRDGDLPWHISADLKRFRKLTTGHCLIMGRKTFQSIGRILPKRKMIVVTRDTEFEFPGAIIVNNIAAALEAAAEDEQPFIGGGAGIYAASLEFVQSIFLTRVHAEVGGDVTFPAIDWNLWELVESSRFRADEKNDHDYSFEKYARIASKG